MLEKTKKEMTKPSTAGDRKREPTLNDLFAAMRAITTATGYEDDAQKQEKQAQSAIHNLLRKRSRHGLKDPVSIIGPSTLRTKQWEALYQAAYLLKGAQPDNQAHANQAYAERRRALLLRKGLFRKALPAFLLLGVGEGAHFTDSKSSPGGKAGRIVMRADAAEDPQFFERVATHEIGHWREGINRRMRSLDQKKPAADSPAGREFAELWAKRRAPEGYKKGENAAERYTGLVHGLLGELPVPWRQAEATVERNELEQLMDDLHPEQSMRTAYANGFARGAEIAEGPRLKRASTGRRALVRRALEGYRDVIIADEVGRDLNLPEGARGHRRKTRKQQRHILSKGQRPRTANAAVDFGRRAARANIPPSKLVKSLLSATRAWWGFGSSGETGQ